jgi:hypothetical protein
MIKVLFFLKLPFIRMIKVLFFLKLPCGDTPVRIRRFVLSITKRRMPCARRYARRVT